MAKACGNWLDVPSANPALLPTKAWVWILIRPGLTYNPVASITFLASCSGILAATLKIFPLVIATSIGALIPFFASTTCPFLMRISIFWAYARGDSAIVANTISTGTTVVKINFFREKYIGVSVIRELEFKDNYFMESH